MSLFIKQAIPFILNENRINDLTNEVFQECTFSAPNGLDWFSQGFIPPIYTNDSLVFKTQDIVQVALQKEEKILPAAVISDLVNEKIQTIEAEEVRNVARKEKQALKEQITDDLLPRAFTRKKVTRGYFTPNILFVDSASATPAEELLSKVRQIMGGLDAALAKTHTSVSDLMTSWLTQKQADGYFVLDSDCLLKGIGEGASSIRASKHDLTADEIKAHLETKRVSQLGLIWADKVRFVLTEDFAFKRIQFLDVLQKEASDEGEDKETLIAAAQIIMIRELNLLFNELVEHLGGLAS
ncbi:recombination-associated protein RdgC [Neisseria sp. Ec49-e6-T10]|uniref:recombination-associated protein RdgC n=1 Tax=Neisseria sp. Ec49-e6-T10 TaxID=3140744 RepID=UPI003EC0DBD7